MSARAKATRTRVTELRLHQCVASRDARLGAAVVDVRLQGGAKLTLGGGP
jgi:hypothetical protein